MGLLLARPATAQAPYNQSDYSDDIIKDNAIYSIPTSIPTPQNRGRQSDSRIPAGKDSGGEYSGRHSTRAERTTSELQLHAYLTSKGSPLAPYASNILESPYWSTIIGISNAEQSFCTIRPRTSPFNCWGIMLRGGGLRKFSSLPEAITCISDLLATYETKYGKDTIEELNGFYVQPASATWLQTVVKTKRELEAL